MVLASAPTQCLTCNVRGLRYEKKRAIIKQFINNKKLDIICLQETYIVQDDVNEWSKLFPKFLFFSSPGKKNSNGLITMIEKNKFSNETILYKSDRILVISCIKNAETFIICNVYSPSDSEVNKRHFYKQISRVIKDLNLAANSSLILAGDFNTAAKIDNISGTEHNIRTISEFTNLATELELYDTWRTMNLNAKEYSWSRWDSKNKILTARRLDYVFTTQNLLEKAIDCEIISVPKTDHRAVLFKFDSKSFKKGQAYYKFNNSLLTNIEFTEHMKTVIIQESNRLINLNPHDKWEVLKIRIKEEAMEYSKVNAAQQKETKRNLEKEINHLEREIGKNPGNNALIRGLYNLKLEQEIYLEAETRAVAVRLKRTWIEKGETNSAYFLNLEKAQKQKTNITRLQSNNVVSNEPATISSEIHKFYETLYTAKTKENPILLAQFHEEMQIPQVSEADNLQAELPISIEEMGKALKALNNNSSPGLDGLTTAFYKIFWTELKQDLFNSFKHSFETDTLTNSQNKGVTTLIHKGKDLPKDNLAHFRPITVTNTDYKIMAKVIAERLKKILPKIISESQVGFIKGRNIAQAIRAINDIIEYHETNMIEGYLLAIDFQKCFDSVSHDYLKFAMKKFGFKENMIKLVMLITNNGESCINNGGWITNFYKLEQGLKQGCPNSPLSYLLVAELLSLKIKQTRNIEGIQIRSIDFTIKLIQYADDTTFFVKNIIDYREILSKIKEFALVSGLHINENKTMLMPLSTSTPQLVKNDDIQQVNLVKILGIYFGTGKNAGSISKNWTGIKESIQQQITSWSKRNLSIKGKIIVTKTFLISQAIYKIQSISLPEQIINELNTMLFSFIWRKKISNKKAYEPLKRHILCLEEEKGGLKMINIKNMRDSFFINWAITLLNNPTSYYMKLPNYFLQSGKGLEYLRINPKKFQPMNIKSFFWKKVFDIFHEHKNRRSQVTSNQYLWHNQNIMYKSKDFMITKWIQCGIKFTKDLLIGGHFVQFDELENRVGKYPAFIFDYYAMKIAVTSYLKNNVVNLNRKTTFKGLPISNEKLNPRYIRNLIENDSNVSLLCDMIWSRKYNIQISKENWLLAIKATRETKLRVIHWKVLHNIYPSGYLLEKMKIKESNLCPDCKEIEYIEHFFVKCKNISHIWKEITFIIQINIDKRITLKEGSILTGFRSQEYPNLIQEELNLLNHVVLIGLMTIGKYRYGKAIDLVSTLQSECRIRNIKTQAK